MNPQAYVALALSIGVNGGLVSGVAVAATGSNLGGALAGGGAAFVAVTTLVLLIMQVTGSFARKP